MHAEAIVYTWDYRSSASIWAALRVQPILSDEVQTFKGLITVHKILQEGHPIVRSPFSRSCSAPPRRSSLTSAPPPPPADAQGGAAPDFVARDVCTDSWRRRDSRCVLFAPCLPHQIASLTLALPRLAAGYGSLIRAYVKLILAKLKFHRHHTAFNGLFEYEEYVALRGIDDPNEG